MGPESERTADLAGLGFMHEEKESRFLAPATPRTAEHITDAGHFVRVSDSP